MRGSIMVESNISLTGHEALPAPDGEQGEGLVLHTTQGDLAGLIRRPPESDAAVLWAGAWRAEDQERRSSPIADAVSRDLVDMGVASLLLRYRRNGQLGSCVQDTRMALAFLEEAGYRRIALVGHSFSGAVVISSAPVSQAVVALVALASQTFGASTVAHVHPRPILLVHGTEDQRLGCHCSEQIYSWAKQPKELVLLEGASHGLWERKDDLLPLLSRWLEERLRPDAPPA